MTELLSCFAFIALDDAVVNSVDDALSIGGKSAQQRLAIADAPLSYEFVISVEDLNPPARVFADIDMSRGVDGNAATIVELSGSDPFLPEFLYESREGVLGRFPGNGGAAGGLVGFLDRAAHRVKRRREHAKDGEHDDDDKEKRNKQHQPKRFRKLAEVPNLNADDARRLARRLIRRD